MTTATTAMFNPTTVPVADLGTACCSCALRTACPPCAWPGAQTQQQGPKAMFSRQRLRAGQPLYCKGDAFVSLHAVRSGSLKTTLTLADGRIQVAGFHLPGEVAGFDGVANGHHQATVTALEDSQTCALDYGLLVEQAGRLPCVQQDLHRLMGLEISTAQWHMLMLGRMSAAERLAALLLDLSRRAAARGYSSTEFNMRMTRIDIGSYLGITPETVSRVIGDFKAMKLLEVDSRYIRLLDLAAFSRTYSATLGGRTPTRAPHRPQARAKAADATCRARR